MSPEPTKDKSLIGAAGVHFVVSELSVRGLITLPTIRNTAGTDVVVVSKDGNWHANLQVKTSRSKVKFWPIGTQYDSWVNKHNFYVFVRYLKEEARFEAFLESSEKVAQWANEYMKHEKDIGHAPWAPCWHLRDLGDRFREQWHSFGSEQ